MKRNNRTPSGSMVLPDLSRRSLLKTGLLGISSLALGPSLVLNPAFGKEDRDQRKYVSLFTGRTRQGVPTTCGLCPAGCGVLAYMDRGRLVGLAGNPGHPYNRGALCALGSAVFNLEFGPQRILAPLRRKGSRGTGAWEIITWSEALDEITKRLGSLLREGGSKSLVVSLPGKDVTPFMDRFVSCFPKSVLDESDRYEGSVDRAIRRDFWDNGEGIPDLAHARLILNFGGNPLGSIRGLVGTAQQWVRGMEQGARWITLDPRLSETANAGHEWVPLRPGTDHAFAAAVARHILDRGMEDSRFLRQQTDLDPTDLQKAFQPWTTKRAAEICRVPVETVHRIAKAFAESPRAVAVYGSSVTAGRGGLESAHAVLLLNLLKGNIGRRGGYRIWRPVSWHQPDAALCGPEVKRVEGSLFHTLGKGEWSPGCLITCHANPAAQDPACESTEEVLKNTEKIAFHVAMSSTWNETVELADLVLPASTYLDAWGVVQGVSPLEGSPWIGLRQPVLSEPGNGRSPEEVFLHLAKRLGGRLGEAFRFESVESYYMSLLKATFSGRDDEDVLVRLRERGFFSEAIPGHAEVSGKERRDCVSLGEGPSSSHGQGERTNTVLSTRKRIVAADKTRRMMTPAVESEPSGLHGTGDWILVLSSSPTGGYESQGCPWIEEIHHAAPVWMNPEAAAEIGCREGDWVLLQGPAGEMKTRVRLTEGIRSDVVAVQPLVGRALTAPAKRRDLGEVNNPLLSDIWWKGERYGENPRRMIPWPDDPSVQAPAWQGTRVSIRRT